MNTFKYYQAAILFGTGALNWAGLGSLAHCMLVSATYVASPSDQFVSAIPAGAIIADNAFASTAINSQGICYGIIPQFNALLSSSPITGMVIYYNTGNPSTSPLIYYSNQGIGFPFLALGFNYGISYNQLNGGWFQA